VFFEDKAEDGSLRAGVVGTVAVHGDLPPCATAPGAFHRSPGPFVVWTPAKLGAITMQIKTFANRNAKAS
jgi:hypothetical protein